MIEAIAAMALAMPYFVWVAVRDNGRGRLAALATVLVALCLAGLAGALGGWWWTVAVLPMETVVAFAHVGARAGRDKKRDEAYN